MVQASETTHPAFGLIVAVLLLALVGCQSTENYTDPEGPLFAGNFAPDPAAFNGELKVITWNIKFGEGVEQAISEMQSETVLNDADFLLLQELDEEAVEKIAQTLNYNYIYFPASVNPRTGRNFGNAILSKWPLTEPKKILLPHENPTNQQSRIAARAVATIDGHMMPLYSVHTETIWLEPAKRYEQIDMIVADIDEDEAFVIVGGDFNTARNSEGTAVVEQFAAADLDYVSDGVGPTVIKAGLDFTADHIFARGFTLRDSGVVSTSTASDHYPVWVNLAPTQP